LVKGFRRGEDESFALAAFELSFWADTRGEGSQGIGVVGVRNELLRLSESTGAKKNRGRKRRSRAYVATPLTERSKERGGRELLDPSKGSREG
jgi:hypothetical protein